MLTFLLFAPIREILPPLVATGREAPAELAGGPHPLLGLSEEHTGPWWPQDSHVGGSTQPSPAVYGRPSCGSGLTRAHACL